MKENNIAAKTKKKFKATTNSKHSYPVAPNILNQDFKATKPNQILIADITYIPTDEGWIYLAAIVDLFHRKVVGWAMDSTMTKQLCIDALNQAIGRCRPSRGLIHHSDRGVQYASNEYKNLLKNNGITQSMSRKGNCYDNACMESFLVHLKRSLFTLQGSRPEPRPG